MSDLNLKRCMHRPVKVAHSSFIEGRVTRLGEILPFWLLIKGEIWFVVCILSVQKYFVEDVLDLKMSFNEDILAYFCFGNCFGYFFKKLGEFFQIFWSPWFVFTLF